MSGSLIRFALLTVVISATQTVCACQAEGGREENPFSQWLAMTDANSIAEVKLAKRPNFLVIMADDMGYQSEQRTSGPAFLRSSHETVDSYQFNSV